ncbi:uncharacterized protein LOC131943908 [Physella acuta]|uniref:uncharacterized protein LOC131943908 n=1 Tax=Physella acuta TaxID=109671 RepID=UPI0027DC482A|nr:uncharacterized protein LOC131943908 [Physella acuta]XP_059160233.1 uncharacterized protein LOC131943908 [Physella acuta]
MSSLDEHLPDDDMSRFFTGTHEVLHCLEGEGEFNLHENMKTCKKNPDHTGFIPVNLFKPEHLPLEFRDEDIFNLTKALVNVTVRIAVKFTSLERPEFIQGTKDQYPGYDMRGKNSQRTGTGRVMEVRKYAEGMQFFPYTPCPCPECELSGIPSKVWFQVLVLTAKHVVYDDSEACTSKCRLWFDEEKCPVVNIIGWKLNSFGFQRDISMFFCVTHDIDVGEKLSGMVWGFMNLCTEICMKYKSRKDADKLTIIVSHPHGFAKQVSVGHWVHKDKSDHKNTRYTYTNCTCPGSSGAMVYRLGLLAGTTNHPHSGTNSSGLNYSGFAFEVNV